MRSIFCIMILTGFLPGMLGGDNAFVRKEKLSDYGFFRGRLSDLEPAVQVLPYSVNTPLFSNYAEKSRFIVIPEGLSATYHDSTAFEFPEGTILIKNFFFHNDFRDAGKGRKILETRLLVRESEGWQAYPYIWNDEQTDAFYDPAGETVEVSYRDQRGKKVSTKYVIPNKNQCKGCHSQGGVMVPIGPSARQLNMSFAYKDGAQNQLAYWKGRGILTGLPAAPPALAQWDDESRSVNDRARAYLDANCGHCHSRKGPGNTSGLYLDIFESNPGHLGVNKAPVAAGRGAGNLQFDISPGEPDESILVFRMKTTDPGIAMPEIGREQVHKEGVELIEEWIRKHTFAKN